MYIFCHYIHRYVFVNTLINNIYITHALPLDDTINVFMSAKPVTARTMQIIVLTTGVTSAIWQER